MLFPATEASRPLSLLNKMKRPKRRRTPASGLLLLLYCRKLPLILLSKCLCEILNVLQALRVLLILVVDTTAR